MNLPMIWFDFGGVLSPPLRDLYLAYEAKTGIAPEQLQDAMREVARGMGLPTLAPVELGLLTEAEWGRRLRSALARLHPGTDLSRARLETFGEQWFDGVTANPVMVGTLRHARENGFRVGVLSNNVPEWEPYWRAIIAPAGELDCLIDSCRVGARKPDEEIFRRAEKEAGVAPGDCVLVDDLAENCEAARRRGWRAVHFRDNGRAVAELRAVAAVPSIL
ncbi:HAD family hydrolase [Streptomyces sp. NPDC059637]|uniref:HAD family hydrolase n=1 Tax=Streptomyces sp. NPDC059637 TaxID=3347752 RepID=UPI0036ABF802